MMVAKKTAKNKDAQPVVNDADQSVAAIAEPPKKYEYFIDRPSSLVPMIADVWNEVKGEGDAAFNDCQPSFQHTLLHHATDVLKSRKVMQKDGPLAAFEEKIALLTKDD
jgi:hypothetical protein